MPKETWDCARCDQVNLAKAPRCQFCQAPRPDDQPAPSIADILRHHGITPCARCAGEGVLKAKTDLLEQTAACGRCDGTGEEPKCPTCGGSGTVERECPDGWVPFPCDCTIEGAAPDMGNNVSMDRAKPGIADMKGLSK